MKRNYLLILIITIVSGAIIFGTGWMLAGGSHSSRNNDQLELKPFKNIELSVMSGDVTIVEGDKYSIEYKLHGREKVETLEVKNDTLYFDTGFDTRWKPASGQWSVLVTVPKGTNFESVNIKSTAGDISFSGYSFENGSFITTSGDVNISDVDCKTIYINTVSHDISLLNSTITEKADLDTVSGSIKVDAPFNTIQAKSVGNIKYNGQSQGGKFSIAQGNPALTAKSVSGEIIIDTK